MANMQSCFDSCNTTFAESKPVSTVPDNEEKLDLAVLLLLLPF